MLLSVDQKQKMVLRKGAVAISKTKNFGPIFGRFNSADIKISDGCNEIYSRSHFP